MSSSAATQFDAKARGTDALPVVTRDPVAAWTIPWQIRPPRPSRTIVVKATCDLVPDSAAVVRAAADLPTGDVHLKDDARRSLLYPSDFAVWKPRADVVLAGHAYAPDGRATCTDVAFRFGRVPEAFARTLRVFGERRWIGRTASAPRPFDRVALVYENAFGGAGISENPAGIGTRPEGSGPWLLPQIEDPAHLVKSPEDMPSPVGFGAIPAAWAARAGRLGTYDAAWQETRWPFFPADFDWLSQQAAPLAQQLDAVRGDEPFEIVGMRPDRRTLRGRLPGVRARAFVHDLQSADRGFFEVKMRLDTVMFDVDAGKVHLVWRGFFESSDERASEAAAVFTMLEGLTASPQSLTEIHGVYSALAAPLAPAAWHVSAANDASEDGISDPSTVAGPTSHVQIQGPDLRGRDLRGASLVDAILVGADLSGANLEGADLRGAQLSGADLSGACLVRANLADADLTGADLGDAVLAGAVLDGARFEDVEAARADFTGASGTRTSFAHGTFREATFAQATLPNADFTSAVLDGAVFDHSVIEGVRFYDARGERVSFQGAVMDGARADGACFEGASFRGASAEGSVWDRATLRGSLLFGARLGKASFAGASCQGAVFSRADLAGADFARARLGGASFLRVQAMFSTFEDADLTGADLRGACLHGAETRHARTDGARFELAIVSATKLEKTA